ncbi:hypothetical protein ACRAWB_08540 [Leifsonia poae]|uniref:hypothetical protein n=1 Tax=Leifsonia poae TaxID=110933 RepID=UPI003D6977DA
MAAVIALSIGLNSATQTAADLHRQVKNATSHATESAAQLQDAQAQLAAANRSLTLCQADSAHYKTADGYMRQAEKSLASASQLYLAQSVNAGTTFVTDASSMTEKANAEIALVGGC